MRLYRHRSAGPLLFWGSLLFVLCVGGGGLCSAAEPKEWTARNLDELVALYKQVHAAPELSFHEEKTSARIAAEFKTLGYEVTEKVGGFGVVGILKNGAGPTVMFRGDMDALPVVERTGLAYASTVKTKNDDGVEVGVTHACGHDVHITNLIAVSRYMAASRDKWSGTLMLIAQPAEERGAGAATMLKDGLFTRFPKPDYALALHVDSFLPTGFVGYRGGFAMANVDSVDITVRGRGGHGSYPHGTIDPIAQAAQLIVDLQTIVSREISPLEPAVVTVGSIHGGTKHNIIPDSCHLQLTVRSYGDKVRNQLKEAIIRKAQSIAKSHRAPEPLIKYSEGTPSLFNHELLVERIVPVFEKTLGAEKVIPADRSMGGEDFSHFGRAGVPIFLFRLGSVKSARLDGFATKGARPPSLHSALYYPDPAETLETGVISSTAALLELMPSSK